MLAFGFQSGSELQRSRPRTCAFVFATPLVFSGESATHATSRKRVRSRDLYVLHRRARGLTGLQACAVPESSEPTADEVPSAQQAAGREQRQVVDSQFIDLLVRAELDDLEDIDDFGDEGGGSADPALDRTRVFGAWLDNQVLEFERIQRASQQHSGQSRQTQAEKAFAQGVREMNTGRYTEASDSIFRASALAGHQTRLGGEYLLWLAQALDAQGKNARAEEVLRRLHYHRDSDVRQVAESLLYILKAPRLRLGPESFVQIDLEAICDPKRARDLPGWKKRQRRYRFGSGTVAALAGAGQRPKEPEKYSLEWFASQERVSPEELEQANQTSSAALLASSGIMIVILLILRYFGH